MDIILARVKWHTCFVYVDDVIVLSRSDKEHLHNMEHELSLLKEKGVFLKASSCHLFQRAVECVGHVIRPWRVAVNEKNTMAFKGLQYPRAQTQLKSFL